MTHEEYLRTPEWKSLKQQALERDQYKCRVCDTSSEAARLNVHHRRYPPSGDWTLDKLDAITTLCESCHAGFSAVRTIHKNTPHKKVALLARGERHVIYEFNPSIPEPGVIDKRKWGKGPNGSFWKDSDPEPYLKLYGAGLEKVVGLSKAGLVVLQMVLKEVQKSPNKDTILLTMRGTDMKKTTYHDGLRELLDEGFLFRSIYNSVYYINVRYIFNGDRIALLRNSLRDNANKIAKAIIESDPDLNDDLAAD